MRATVKVQSGLPHADWEAAINQSDPQYFQRNFCPVHASVRVNERVVALAGESETEFTLYFSCTYQRAF